MVLRIFPIVLIACLWLAGCKSGPTVLKVGDTAPDIQVAEWLSGELKGGNPFLRRVVILEFWATWCGPCRMTIPHMNALVEKYARYDIIFVSMTDENREVVKKFMAETPMKAAVVIDKNQETERAYGIQSIPHMYVIDKNNVIQWEGHPQTMTEEAFGDLLAKM